MGNKVRRMLACVVGVCAIAMVMPISAQAAQYNVSGYLNTGGYLVQYSTFRWHTSGEMSMTLSDNVETYSQFGLRGTDDVQQTPTIQFKASEINVRKVWGLGSTGSYALNGRMGPRSGADNKWEGKMVL
ncbi:hypothetical protein [Bifidobacterium phasiani]|uniref:Uncharacterized protein n=1 Tax=Bifidobacterium phasiani TaxID=2834431 RepID=A0ABS6W730_9BIFI|nr:hypothetical protein [Bifidobacterium phasiani]MBW3082308.1 hypothetical protein [Bifidobacterium phasiani]